MCYNGYIEIFQIRIRELTNTFVFVKILLKI